MAWWAASWGLLWQQAVLRLFEHADVNPAPLLQDACWSAAKRLTNRLLDVAKTEP